MARRPQRRPDARGRGQLARSLATDLRAPSRELAASFLEAPQLEEALAQVYAEVLRQSAGEPTPASGQKDAASDKIARIVEGAIARWAGPLFDRFKLEYFVPLERAARGAFSKGAVQGAAKIGIHGSFDLRNPRVLQAIGDRANMLSGDVADTTFDEIKSVIARGFYDDRLGPPDVARRLAAEFDFLTRTRSMLIARTETLVAQSSGAFRQYEEIGVRGKDWLETDDGRTRTSHQRVKSVAIDEPFRLEDEKGRVSYLMFPGDPDGPPAEICNCRCDHAPIVEEGRSGGFWDGS